MALSDQFLPLGRNALEHIPKQHVRKVDKFISAPRAVSKQKSSEDLMMVHWIDDKFILKSESGFTRVTKVTESEDVSYVSSPHLPFYVRAQTVERKKLTSNMRKHGGAGSAGPSGISSGVSAALESPGGRVGKGPPRKLWIWCSWDSLPGTEGFSEAGTRYLPFLCEEGLVGWKVFLGIFKGSSLCSKPEKWRERGNGDNYT